MEQLKKITVGIDEELLQEDLKRYQEKAVELGATRARVMPVEDIVVDERVTLKCQVPLCFGYGTCANCPPHTLKPDELRSLLKKYKWAIFFTQDVPSEVIIRDKATIKERVAVYQKMFSIVNELESLAFYDGHYFSVGFASGSCRHTYCGLQENCQVQQGDKCRFSLKSRPSMEAVGMDVYQMAAKSGWEIYPIGSGAKKERVPKGVLGGIVVVG